MDNQSILNKCCLKKINQFVGFELGSEIAAIVFDDNSQLIMQHIQNCCETVELEDIIGNLDRHIGATLVSIEERVSQSEDLPQTDDSNTWTFYTIITSKGYIDLRWHGSSNGYYSESVDLQFIPS